MGERGQGRAIGSRGWKDGGQKTGNGGRGIEDASGHERGSVSTWLSFDRTVVPVMQNGCTKCVTLDKS